MLLLGAGRILSDKNWMVDVVIVATNKPGLNGPMVVCNHKLIVTPTDK